MSFHSAYFVSCTLTAFTCESKIKIVTVWYAQSKFPHLFLIRCNFSSVGLNKKRMYVYVCTERSWEVEWCQCQCSPSLLTLSWWLPSKCLHPGAAARAHTQTHKALTSSSARATALSASRAGPAGWATSSVFPESPVHHPTVGPNPNYTHHLRFPAGRSSALFKPEIL